MQNFKSTSLLIEHPMLLAKWKVSAVKLGKDGKRVSFTVAQMHRIEIIESPDRDDKCDVTVTKGMYKKQKTVAAHKVEAKDLPLVIDKLLRQLSLGN